MQCNGWWSMTTLWVMGMDRLATLGRKSQQGAPASGPALNSSQSTVKFNPQFMHSPSAPLKRGLKVGQQTTSP